MLARRELVEAAVAAVGDDRLDAGQVGQVVVEEQSASPIRTRKGRAAKLSMVMIDGQTVRGGRAGPTCHEKGGRGGRTNGAKRSIVIEILGLPGRVREAA